MKKFYEILKTSNNLLSLYPSILEYIREKYAVNSIFHYQAEILKNENSTEFHLVDVLGEGKHQFFSLVRIPTSDFTANMHSKSTHLKSSSFQNHFCCNSDDNQEYSIQCFPMQVDNKIHACSFFVDTDEKLESIGDEIMNMMFVLQNIAEKEYYQKGHSEYQKQNRELKYGLDKTKVNLRMSEDKMNSINSISSIGMAYLRDGIVSDFDEHLKKMLGLSNEHSEAVPLQSLIVNYQDYSHKFISQIEQAKTAIVNCRIQYKGAKAVDVQLILTPSSESDTTFIISVHDITKRKEAEHLQELIFDINKAVNTTSSLHEFIAFIREGLKGLINTDNFYIALYHPEEDELSLPYYNDEKDSFDRVSAKNTLTAKVIKSRKAALFNKEEINHLFNSGEIELMGTIPEIWMGIPLIHQSVVVGMIGIQNYEDGARYTKEQFRLMKYLAEQFSFLIMKKNQEVSLQEAKNRAMESDRLKTSFLSNVSHEIRTPMNAILGFSELLSTEDISPEEMHLYVNLIHKNGHDLMDLINDMIDIAKIESGEIQLAKADVSVHQLINDAKQRHIKAAQQKGIDIKIDSFPVDHDVFLFSDPFRLQQIVHNLLDNAIKYGLSHDVRIGYNILDNKEFIELYVIDYGLGIPEEMQEVIFDPFRQINESHIKTTGGNGLGLSITKSITKLLGGSIRLKSKKGFGSHFYIKLPIEEEKFIQTKNGNKGSFDWSGKNILVAEDVLHNFQFLDVLLTRSGAKVSWAKNGLEAVKMVEREQHFDLILMDIQMPMMDGLTATRIIKNKFPHIPIVAQTAFAESTLKQDVLDAGCDDFIFKPIKTNDLLKKISILLCRENDND